MPALHPVEIFAVLFLLAYVLLAARESRWCWPVSIIGVVLYSIQAVKVQLYGEIPLQLYYVAVSVYAWFAWKGGKGKKGKGLAVSRMTHRQWLLFLGSGTALTLAYGYFLAHIVESAEYLGWENAARYLPPSAYPYADAFTTAFSFLATWLQARKKIENWLIWLIVDSVYIALWSLRGGYFFALLSLLYLGLSVYGYRKWRVSLRQASLSASS